MKCPKCGTDQIGPLCSQCGYQFNPVPSDSPSEKTLPIVKDPQHLGEVQIPRIPRPHWYADG